MNRYKKEEKKKYDDARKGLTKEEVIALNLKDEISEKIRSRARAIHIEKFPEEYDMMGDSFADANDRARGINPMSQEYIDKIKIKRRTMGVTPLAENGKAGDDTYQLCLEEAKKEFCTNLKMKRPPTESCVFCERTIENIGGKRIVAQKFKGITLSKTDDYKEDSHQFRLLFSNPDVYMSFWGGKSLWTKAALESAKTAFLNIEHPWFCQICGNRTCNTCGSPIQFPMGSDVIYSNGDISHTPIFPFESGCINDTCNKYNPSKQKRVRHE